MRERNVKTLELTGYTEQSALGVGRTHAVHIVFIVQRRPQKHRLAERFRDVRRRFLVAEITVDDENGVHLLGTKPLHRLCRRGVVKHQILDADSFCVHKGDLVGGKMLLDVLHKAMPTLLRGIPRQKRAAGAVGRVAAHRQQADLDRILLHTHNSFLIPNIYIHFSKFPAVFQWIFGKYFHFR